MISGLPRAIRTARAACAAGWRAACRPWPGNVRLAVTANCRAIVPRHGAEQDDPLNPRDALDDQLALADRFGLALGFHAIDQATYLEIVAAYAAHHGLDHDQAEALAWARQRGARSGRTAWQFVTELAGRAGRRL